MEVMLMMSVKEYASDVNLSVGVILKLCDKLGISASSEDDMLDDDGIIMLDNEVANLEEQVSEEENTDAEGYLCSAASAPGRAVIQLHNRRLFTDRQAFVKELSGTAACFLKLLNI